MVSLFSPTFHNLDEDLESRDPYEVLEELKKAEEEAKKVQAKEKLKKDKAGTKVKPASDKSSVAKSTVQQKAPAPAPTPTTGQVPRTNTNRTTVGGRGGNRQGNAVTFATDSTTHRETGDNRSFIKHSSGGFSNNASGGAPISGSSNFSGNRGSGGGRGNSAGGRGGAHPFDRHSGSRVTGVKAVEKRQGSGPHNWGSTNDQMEGELEGAAEAAKQEQKQQDSPSKEEGAEGATEAVEGENDAAAVQPGVREMTLNEYLAKDESERSRLGSYLNKGAKDQAKKKSQRVDLNKVLKEYQQVNGVKGVTVYQKGADEDVEDSDDEEMDVDAHGNSKKGQAVDFRINYGTTRGGASGNRRGGPGGRGNAMSGRGGGQGRPSGAGASGSGVAAINLDSKDDFPALG